MIRDDGWYYAHLMRFRIEGAEFLGRSERYIRIEWITGAKPLLREYRPATWAEQEMWKQILRMEKVRV